MQSIYIELQNITFPFSHNIILQLNFVVKLYVSLWQEHNAVSSENVLIKKRNNDFDIDTHSS